MSMAVTNVYIITVDTSESVWAIEGKITFDEELTLPFEATYDSDTDEFENLTIEDAPSSYDLSEVKQHVLNAASNFD